MLGKTIKAKPGCRSNSKPAVAVLRSPLFLQTMASPFRFDRLLHGVGSVPYVLTAMAATTRLPTSSHADTAVRVAPAVSLADVTAAVRSRVHAMLSPEVRLPPRCEAMLAASA